MRLLANPIGGIGGVYVTDYCDDVHHRSNPAKTQDPALGSRREYQ